MRHRHVYSVFIVCVPNGKIWHGVIGREVMCVRVCYGVMSSFGPASVRLQRTLCGAIFLTVFGNRISVGKGRGRECLCWLVERRKKALPPPAVSLHGQTMTLFFVWNEVYVLRSGRRVRYSFREEKSFFFGWILANTHI